MKKKLLAILLAVVMVVSALVVLTACKDTEYTVTFSNINGTEYFTLTTKDGKLSQEEVEAETAKLSNGDMTFMGWYATLGYDQATDQTTYSDPIDYDTVYEDNDVEYYAYWFGGSGSENGYTVVGVIGEDTCWDEVPEDHDSWILQQDSTKKWLYSVTLDLVGNNNFKVKEIAPGWDGECGYDKLAEVTIADGADVDLPDDTTAADLFSSVGMGNIGLSASVETMNLTIIYDHSIGKLRLVINSATILEEAPVYDYIIVGTLKEGEWNTTSKEDAVMFKATDDENIYTLEYTFRKGDKWQVTLNNGAWSWQVGGSNINSVTAATDIDVTNETETADDDLGIANLVATNFKGSGDITTVYACTVIITIDVENSKIDIEVTAITIDEIVEAPTEPDMRTWSLITSENWSDVADMVEGENGHKTLTHEFTSVVEFKLRADHDWADSVGPHSTNVTVQGDAADLFVNEGGNFTITAPCTISFDLIWYSEEVWTLIVTVTAAAE